MPNKTFVYAFISLVFLASKASAVNSENSQRQNREEVKSNLAPMVVAHYRLFSENVLFLSQEFPILRTGLDGQVNTLNKQGANWKASAQSIEFFDQSILGLKNPHVLIVGPAFGANLVAFMQRYSDLKVSAVELSEQHIKIMVALAKEKGVNDRLNVISSSFLKLEKNHFREKFDAVLMLKVLHFFNDEELSRAFELSNYFLKMDGYVVTSNISAYVLRGGIGCLIRNLFHGWLPQPRYGANHFWEVQWARMLTKENLANIADKNGFHGKQEYCAITGADHFMNKFKFFHLPVTNVDFGELSSFFTKSEDRE